MPDIVAWFLLVLESYAKVLNFWKLFRPENRLSFLDSLLSLEGGDFVIDMFSNFVTTIHFK